MRLIDVDALRKRMFSYYSCVDENSSKEYYKGETLMSYEVADMIEDCIDNAPTVDAVPVVRCKDCKHFDENNACYCHAADDNGTPIFVRDHDFCSYGERRDSDV